MALRLHQHHVVIVAVMVERLVLHVLEIVVLAHDAGTIVVEEMRLVLHVLEIVVLARDAGTVHVTEMRIVRHVLEIVETVAEMEYATTARRVRHVLEIVQHRHIGGVHRRVWAPKALVRLSKMTT
jgi:hypothetical protein